MMMATSFPLDDDGVWCEVLRPCAGELRPALFVDRDGTLIELVPYLSDPTDVRLIAAALALVRAANRFELPVVVITNQSGIARGLYGWAEFAAVQARLLTELAAAGCTIDAVMACPAGPDSDAPCRKPNPGMFTLAAARLPINLARSWIVGDSVIDLEAGRRAGLGRGWLAPTGYGPLERDAAAALAGTAFDVTLLRPIDELAGELAAD